MTIKEIYDYVTWSQANYSRIEDLLLATAIDYPGEWSKIEELEVILKSVQVGKLNSKNTKTDMRLQAKQMMED